MLVLVSGLVSPPRVRRVTRQMREDVGIYEHDPTVQSRLNGRFKLNVSTGEWVLIGPERVYISPLLQFTLDDFPVGTEFGNGATGPRSVEFRRTQLDGEVTVWIECFSTLVFPYETELSDAQINRIREITEGIPPGNPIQNVWRPFTEHGGLESSLIETELAELKAKDSPSAMEQRLIADMELLQTQPVSPVTLPTFPILQTRKEQLMAIGKDAWTDAQQKELIELLVLHK
jgi:hypothetical protein